MFHLVIKIFLSGRFSEIFSSQGLLFSPTYFMASNHEDEAIHEDANCKKLASFAFQLHMVIINLVARRSY